MKLLHFIFSLVVQTICPVYREYFVCPLLKIDPCSVVYIYFVLLYNNNYSNAIALNKRTPPFPENEDLGII